MITREIRSIFDLSDEPKIVKAYDYFRPNPIDCYILMEYVRGVELDYLFNTKLKFAKTPD